jgi:dephospho-CoA kinase
VALANELRANHSPSYLAEQLFEQAKKSGKNCIIESIRTIGEVEALRAKGNFILFAIDADQRVRYERAYSRASETDHIDFETFVENEHREMQSDDPNKQNLSACMARADYRIENNGTLEDIYKKVDEALEAVGKRIPSWDEYFIEIAKVTAKRSKDPSTQTGCVIVDKNNRPISFGYNGFI